MLTDVLGDSTGTVDLNATRGKREEWLVMDNEYE